ncbi:hypothetical protein [Actinacidiphila epipremni]|uniref:Uncharacterized protein n=1 Tax=Actinacidiphila epipremni TaxID=2053013 RepID=A0ABX0ZUP5_9ACTN|nr:hypothetical protein [Actinacidiphila epipremni]NJP46347.1 hypothetical protein [Actinacidiphila epipremni]
MTGRPAGAAPAPAVLVVAFVLFLAVVFGASYAAGAAAGPVNPRMHPAPTGAPADGHGGTGDMGGMGGMG